MPRLFKFCIIFLLFTKPNISLPTVLCVGLVHDLGVQILSNLAHPDFRIFLKSNRDIRLCYTLRLAVWLSGNALASINVVALRQTGLVPGWVTVCGRLNHLGM